MNLEVTCRIPREELAGLLNTMTPFEQQRITAEMEVAKPPAELAIRFKQPRLLMQTRMIVITASFTTMFGPSVRGRAIGERGA